MSDIEIKIREEAKRVLESGDVSLIIGWGKGSVPFKTTPVFISKPEDTQQLVWNPACVNNLAVYLPKMADDKKVGIVAKPCDIRSIVALLQEKQIKRENVHIIGLGCGGVVDASDLDRADFNLRDITVVDWANDGISVTTTSGAHVLESGTCLRDMCIVCEKREPAIFDAKFGEAAEPQDGEICALPELPEDRRKYWSEQFEKCIRCYACRQVCPNCYCEACFADRIEPKWTAKKATANESWMFHATRAMHLAGRCIGCGECERVCPVDIPIAQLELEMARIAKDRYGYEPGDPNEEAPLLGQFREIDHDPGHHGG